MKISASVPDDLLNQAKAAMGESSISALVQEGLRRVAKAAPRSDRPYAVRPSLNGDAEGAMARLREKYLAEAKQNFQQGYLLGIELAGELSWSDLTWIVESGLVKAAAEIEQLDLHAAAFPGIRNPSPGPRRELLIKYLGAIADGFGQTDWRQDPVVIEGMDGALQDVHDSVELDDPSSAPTPASQP